MGWREAPNARLHRHGLHGARWAALAVRRRWLPLVGRTWGAMGGDLTVVIDETLERHWGRHHAQRGHARQPLASRQPRSVASRGWRWIILTLGSTPPWTPRSWALPLWCVPASTPAVSRRWGRRHTTGPPWAHPMRRVVRRGLPASEMTVSGDHPSRVLELGGA